MILALIFLITGGVTGLLAGLFGLGGGVLLVPALAFVFAHHAFPQTLVMHMAAGTSLAIMIITTFTAFISHYRRGTVWMHLLRQFLPGIMIGVVVGILMAGVLSTTVLCAVFAVVLMLIALHVLKRALRKPDPQAPVLPPQVPGSRSGAVVSAFIGLFSGMLGIGAGSMLVPYLLYHRVKMSMAAGTACALTCVVACEGTVLVILNGWSEVTMPWATGYIYWPAVLAVGVPSVFFAPIGAMLSRRLSSRVLQVLLGVLLCFLSLHLFFVL